MLKVYSVQSVTVTRLNTQPEYLLVTALGQVISSGWTVPRLVEHSSTEPSHDGYIDFDFVASPPSGPTHPALYPVIVHHLWQGGQEGVNGVRVHCSSNSAEAATSDDAPVAAAASYRDAMMIEGPYPVGVPVTNVSNETGSSPAAPAAAPRFAKEEKGPPILLGGTLKSEEPGEESTGFLLYDVLVEIEASKIPDPTRFVGRQVVVEGRFELQSYPRRGAVWTFVARSLRAPRM